MRFIHRGVLGLSLLVASAGCGDDGTGGAGGEASTTGSTSKASGSGTSVSSGSGNSVSSGSGTATASGSGATTVSASDASASSSSGNCPDIQCQNQCPMGFWEELDGCDSCACETVLVFAQDGNGLNATYISVSAQAAPIIGGIDRWELRFTFDYDDPQATDDQQTIVTSVRIPEMDLTTGPGMKNETHVPTGGAGEELELQDGVWSLFGFAVFMEDLTATDGFLSIRRNGMVFEGFVSLDFDSDESTKTFHVSGPFTAQIPPI